MKRTILYVTLALAVLVPAAGSECAAPADPFGSMPGQVLSETELEDTSGSLRIFGIEILPRVRRIRRRQKTTDESKVHCDIIAQNKADDLGLNTNNQDGTMSDYNDVTVSQIYDEFPDNRHSTPPSDTAGYVFTAYGGDMQHLEAYSRRGSGNTYTRYSNDSYTGSSSIRPIDYVPPGVTDQSFVPLPRYHYSDLYHR